MSSLAEVSLPDLERLSFAFERSEPDTVLSREVLVRAQLDHLAPYLGGLVGRDVATVRAVLDAVIAERRRPPATKVSLVWTGPETRSSGARDTSVVVRDLFEGATRHVLIAGYSFERGESILAPLHAAMRDRGVTVEMFVHLDGTEVAPIDAEWFLRTQAAAWRGRFWPFGAPTPTLYVDPRAAVPKSYASLHAKCIVVDGARALVGSANFTDRGQTRNIEAGVLVEDARFVTELVRQFHDAVGAGLFVVGTP